MNFQNMFSKVIALCLFLGICLAIPIEETKHPVANQYQVPVVLVPQQNGKNLPPAPPADSSDLKTDPSTWYHSYWYHTYPTYYYYYHTPGPNYNYWHNYY